MCAVRLRLRHEVGAERAVGAGLVLDDDGLAEDVLDLVGDQAADEIGRAAGGKAITMRIGRLGKSCACTAGAAAASSSKAAANLARRDGTSILPVFVLLATP